MRESWACHGVTAGINGWTGSYEDSYYSMALHFLWNGTVTGTPMVSARIAFVWMLGRSGMFPARISW